MNATGGLRAPGGAAPAGERDGSRLATRSRAPFLRTVLGLGRAEASLLVRSPLVLAGLLAGGAVVWVLIWAKEPLWWDAAWKIGFGQAVLGTAVLAAAQLATGRARRNAMADLYASFPATAGTRALAQLAGLAGAAPAGLLLIGATAVLVQLHGGIGAPSIAVLAGGLLLVIAAGAAGVAIGTRFAHPLAGVLGALVFLLACGQSNRFSGAVVWLLPWEIQSDQQGQLPGPLAGYPPVGAHVLELAGIAAVAGIVALALTARGARARGALAAAGVLAVAVICAAGALQLRPIPTADLNQVVTEAADPATVQHCTTQSQVRYCLYPEFGRLLASLEAPVSGVLAHLPARPPEPLTVRQVVSLNLPDSTLTHGHSNQQVSRWTAELQSAPGSSATAAEIYLPVGSWPAAGGRLEDARFDVALAAADWAVRLPPTRGNPSSSRYTPCVPLDQAREAIAIWLAIVATRPPAGELQNGLGSPASGIQGTEVRNTMIRVWAYPGSGAQYVAPGEAGPQTTAAGYLLASAMTGLPQQKVAHVLSDAWGTWTNWHTTDAQLAAALGIRMPSIPALPTPGPGMAVAPGPGNAPQSPVCTT